MNQTQQQIEKLKSLQESLDWAIDLAENQLPELKSALQEIKDGLGNITIDLSPVAKEETLNSSIAALSALIEDIPSKVAVTRVTDLVATENDKEYIANDYGVDGFGKVKTELRNLVKVTQLSVSKYCINKDGRWDGEKLIDTSECTKISFYNCDNLNELYLSDINTEKVTSLSECFRYCRGNYYDLRNWNLPKCTTIAYLFFSTYTEKINILGWETPNIESATRAFEGCTTESIVGDTTIEQIKANNLFVFGNLSISLDLSTAKLNRASLRALINGIADVTDQPAESRPTLTLGATLMAKLTDEDRVIATEKGWNLA